MKVKLEFDVGCCVECPHSTNDVREWDDPFTSAPASPTWYCRHKERTDGGFLSDPYNEIDENCPVKEAKKQKRKKK